MEHRIYLSPPDVSPADEQAILEAFRSGWVAPAGPELGRFEKALSEVTGRSHAVALSSGTAGLHLGLLAAGVSPGDRVLVSTLTFVATANAVRYLGAEPVFVDSTPASWNIDPELVGEELEDAARRGRRYAACIAVDIYGQCADYGRLTELCDRHGVYLLEDAAEALGATYQGRPAGSFGDAAVLSFNGNKIITTSGGGAYLTDSADAAQRVRYLSTQARQPVVHYEHTEVGFNYRLSNLLAALGRSQLDDLDRRVEARRAHNRAYREALGDLPGIEFMPEAPECRSTFWLTCILVHPEEAGVDRDAVRTALDRAGIEARPVWKPMHLQPVYAECRMVGGGVADRLFERGLCLPSGSNLTEDQRDRIVDVIRSLWA